MFLERAGKAGLESGAEKLAKAGLLAADKYGLQAAEKHGTYVLLGLSLLSLATVAGFGLVAKQLVPQHPPASRPRCVPLGPRTACLQTFADLQTQHTLSLSSRPPATSKGTQVPSPKRRAAARVSNRGLLLKVLPAALPSLVRSSCFN
jgi:hypothetical protein